jgi:hypothetical protein
MSSFMPWVPMWSSRTGDDPRSGATSAVTKPIPVAQVELEFFSDLRWPGRFSTKAVENLECERPRPLRYRRRISRGI